MPRQTSRQAIYSKVSPFEDRLATWTEAVAASREHIRLGKGMQAQGVEILKAAQPLKHDPEALSKLLQQAANIFDKGVKIDRESHSELMDLQQNEPRDK